MKSLLLTLGVLVGAATTAPAAVLAQSISYEHHGVKLVGYLAYDDALARGGKLPAVLVVPEWWGLNDYVKGRARQLAALGLVAFVADMYGDGQVTADATKAGELAGQFYGKPLMAERAQAALDQLVAQPAADPAKVAAIGYCFGGSTVQALAYSGARLAGIVSFHGGILPVPADAGSRLHAKILLCSGAADPMVPAKDVEAFKQSMAAGNLDYVLIEYANARHAFTNPEATEAGRKNHMDAIAYNAEADRRSWQHMQDFFHEIFAAR